MFNSQHSDPIPKVGITIILAFLPLVIGYSLASPVCAPFRLLEIGCSHPKGEGVLLASNTELSCSVDLSPLGKSVHCTGHSPRCSPLARRMAGSRGTAPRALLASARAIDPDGVLILVRLTGRCRRRRVSDVTIRVVAPVSTSPSHQSVLPTVRIVSYGKENDSNPL